jgi:hypothetical protein
MYDIVSDVKQRICLLKTFNLNFTRGARGRRDMFEPFHYLLCADSIKL